MVVTAHSQEETRLARFIRKLLPRRWRPDYQEIPVVRLHGMIMTGGGPFRQNLSLSSTAAVLEKAFGEKDAPAVAISINSPGGSPVQSRLIYRRMFVEDVAASGGYMIAIAGDEIVADPSSIVGSIGVVSASFGFTELIKKIGVERRVHTAGKNKATLDPFRPENKEDIEHLKALQLEIHETFINLVKERRGEKLSDNPDLFTGLFWTGTRGVELGLVDGLGDMRSYLQSQYGPKTRLKLITQPRGMFGRKIPSTETRIEAFGANLANGVISAAEERALWSRFGL